MKKLLGHIEGWNISTGGGTGCIQGDGGTAVIKPDGDGALAMVYPDGNG